MWSSARSEAALLAELPAPIEIKPIRGARRLRLRYDEIRGILKLTCPTRTSRRSALSWAVDQRDWIEAQLARAEPCEPFVSGATIPVEGRETRLVWAEGQPRTPVLVCDELRSGGPQAGFERRITTWLKRRALDTMSLEVAEFCSLAGVTASGVTVGDAGSRWGSCSSDGRIRLSWRLIMAPPEVRRHVVSHEVAHIVHLNHGPQFKALEARLFGTGLAAAKSQLRAVGPRLRRLGRGS
jgi:predicted metal-dependent hydrolase